MALTLHIQCSQQNLLCVHSITIATAGQRVMCCIALQDHKHTKAVMILDQEKRNILLSQLHYDLQEVIQEARVLSGELGTDPVGQQPTLTSYMG